MKNHFISARQTRKVWKPLASTRDQDRPLEIYLSRASTLTIHLSPTEASTMATPHASMSRLLNPLLQSFRSLSLSTNVTTLIPMSTQMTSSTRAFSTTPANLAKHKGAPKKDPRITLIRYHLQHPETPRPLRLSRMRALRHWTIHRAWMLARRKKMKAEEGELMRYAEPFSSQIIPLFPQARDG